MNDASEVTEDSKAGSDKTVKWTLIVCGIGFGIFLLWSIFVPLDEGVTVSGRIVAEDNRKVIQHLEGGIVKEVRVRDGEMVKPGQTLIVLEEVAAESGRDEIAQELGTQLASVDRLKSLASSSGTVSFPSIVQADLRPAQRQAIEREQAALFRQQADAHAQDIRVLRSRASSLRSQRGAVPPQMDALFRARASTRRELDHIRPLLAENLVTEQRVSSLERELARIDGEIARLRADSTRFGGNAAEVDAQVAQARAVFRERISTEMLDARRAILALREQLDSSADVLDRTVIVAPQDGEVLNLSVTTPGAVIRPGEPVMEIVPPNSDVIVEVQVSPGDRDSVYRGLSVDAQLSAYKNWQSPRLDGEVVAVSADLKEDPVTGMMYYAARIRLTKADAAEMKNVRLSPGMPVDAFVSSGQQRSFMSYMVEPIWATVKRGLSMT